MSDWRDVVRRVTALIIGPLYLLYIASILAFCLNCHSLTGLLITLMGSAIIAASLVAFGVKVFRGAERVHRFNLSSVFLFIIPLSVYLAGIRLAIGSIVKDGIMGQQLLIISILSLFFVAFSTVVLLCLTEALMWLAVHLVWRRSNRRPPT